MLLDICNLHKRFDGVRALDGADLAVAAGTVHGLLGENGAGKSTLIRVLAGLIAPDAGSVTFAGRPFRPGSVHAAEAAGLRVVHQEPGLVPHFDTVENCFVGRPYPRRGPFMDRRAMHRQVVATAARIAPDLPLDRPAGRMTTGQRQMAAVVRALMLGGARLVVMDEPTASLSEGEAGRLRGAIRSLAAEGVAVIFVSHRLDEVLELCDRYTVLRNGRTAGSGAVAGVGRADLIRLMTGSDRPEAASRSAHAAGPPRLELRDLRFGPPGARLSLSVHRGEIVGLYGLIGAGRSALLQQVWGARRHRGQITLDGKELPPGNIAARIRAGGAYVPEDRRGQGLITTRSIAENLAIANLRALRSHPRLPVTSARRLAARAESVRERLSVRMGSVHDLPLSLSGGNQQKLVFGRWLGRPLRLVLLDEPSRGVDVGAKAEIHAIIRDLAAEGAAVLMVTSDLDELLALSDRVLVLAGGRVTAELATDTLTPGRVLAAAFAPARPAPDVATA